MVKGFVVYPTYKTEKGKAVVHLFGRLENGKTFLAKCDFKPYFFIKDSDADKAKGMGELPPLTIEPADLFTFDGEKVQKVETNSPKDVPSIRKAFEDAGIATFESDIRYAYRFMIDHSITGSLEIDGESSRGEDVDLVYDNPKVRGIEPCPTNLKMLSFDIETDAKGSQVYCISLFTKGHREVLIHSGKKLKNARSFPDEKSVLSAFKQAVYDLDPDIITGWNVVDFDLSVLKKRFEHFNIPFDFSKAGMGTSIKQESSFFRESTAKIPGRMVLDGLALLRNSFIKLDDYTLENTAKEILGESKLLKGKERKYDIENAYKENQQLLVDYNLKDAELVYRIIEKTGVIDLSIQRSMLTGMQLDRVKASIASLDNLYLREARTRKMVCPTMRYTEEDEEIKGGYVRDPVPGIYDYVAVFDFKSLYPSIICTFNIDPASYDPKGKAPIVAPNGAHFKQEDGILPLLIQKLWRTRDEAKRAKNDLASYAIKITMNSFYGVLANPNCRFYSTDVANAITHFGRQIIQVTAEQLNDKGYSVIYGDTDSVFVDVKANSLKEAEAIGGKIPELINSYYSRMVTEKYHRKSFLELEFEKTFIRLLMPKVRKQEAGAKKRYAGLVMKEGKEQAEFTGLEIVRRDWTELAKNFQYELFDFVFHKRDPAEFVRDYVEKLEKGKFDDKLVYVKALRKPINEYTKTTPPHVKAARKLPKLTSDLIKYVMTVAGPEPVEALANDIDYEHYKEKQLKPIADSILTFFGTSFDDLLKGKQKSLFDY